jgi:hypothetical protein
VNVTQHADREPAIGPAPPELCDRIRKALGGETSRRALTGFGVTPHTLLAALAGFPVNRGSLASIREALQKMEEVAAAEGVT